MTPPQRVVINGAIIFKGIRDRVLSIESPAFYRRATAPRIEGSTSSTLRWSCQPGIETVPCSSVYSRDWAHLRHKSTVKRTRSRRLQVHCNDSTEFIAVMRPGPLKHQHCATELTNYRDLYKKCNNIFLCFLQILKHCTLSPK